MPEKLPDEGDRIAKVIARAGVCSRRDAEKLIAEGKVSLNGEPVTTPATKVGAQRYGGGGRQAAAEPEPARLWRYHKPAGLVTTHRDEKGRATVFANLPKEPAARGLASGGWTSTPRGCCC